MHYESLPDEAATDREPRVYDLTWDLEKLEKPVPLHRPRSTNSHALELPYQIGFTGSVTVTGTKETTVTYGANGSFRGNECKLDAQGRELACPDYVKFRWGGNYLVTEWQEVHAFGPPDIVWRNQYRYDKQHRVVRVQGEVGDDGLVLNWIATLEYRCNGIEGYREP